MAVAQSAALRVSEARRKADTARGAMHSQAAPNEEAVFRWALRRAVAQVTEMAPKVDLQRVAARLVGVALVRKAD